MHTTAGLPLPSLFRGRFVYDRGIFSHPETMPGDLWAYTDEALFKACNVRIAFSERSGGISGGPFASLDMGAPQMMEDAEYRATSMVNRQALMSAFHVPELDRYLICPKQIHGDTIVTVSSEAADDFLAAQESAQRGADAILVTCTDRAALLRFADCLPLILVAPGAQFAVVHCGWRGTVAHLASKAARALVELSESSPDQINAYIGPYIHAECFQVGSDVARDFKDAFHTNVFLDANHIDLGCAVKEDLTHVGLIPQRIVDVDICSACNTDAFYSYRASEGNTGRHGAFACCITDQKEGQ